LLELARFTCGSIEQGRLIGRSVSRSPAALCLNEAGTCHRRGRRNRDRHLQKDDCAFRQLHWMKKRERRLIDVSSPCVLAEYLPGGLSAISELHQLPQGSETGPQSHPEPFCVRLHRLHPRLWRGAPQRSLTDHRTGPTLYDMKLEVEKLSLRELDLLVIAAERRKKVLASRRPLAVVRRELIALATSHGYAIEDVLNVPPTAGTARKPAARRKLGKVAAKYRDPENKRNTWSGRGRMPRWLADRTKRGQSIADFLIPGLGRPTAKKSNLIGRRSVYKQR